MKHPLEQLQFNGLKYGDQLIIHPLHGKQQTQTLLRTQFEFLSTPPDKKILNSNQLSLPTLLSHPFHYRLTLTNYQFNQKKLNCYRLTSLTELPFRRNGTYSFDSFLEREDTIEFGPNALYFRPQPSHEESSYKEKIMELLLPELLKPSFKSAILYSPLNILLEGETGTGKGFLAQWIYEQSKLKGKFVQINLSSLAPSLIESELFGHLKGAFTGADHHKVGLIAEANEGLLFLDEINSLPLELQCKLLHLLDQKKIRPVGSNYEKEINLRILFATNRSLEECLAKGVMREDFYYRLKMGLKLSLPSLRSCPHHIPEICDILTKKDGYNLDPSLYPLYQQLSWRGNLRELNAHLLKKIYMTPTKYLSFDRNDSDLLQEEHVQSQMSIHIIDYKNHTLNASLHQIKKQYCYQVYLFCQQNIKRTAEILQITTKTVQKILQEE